MSLALDDDQRMLADTARDFIAKRAPLERIRQLRDAAMPLCYDRSLYGQMTELGWTAIAVSEAHGGLGLGLGSLILVTEAMGRGLAPEPIVSCGVLAARLLEDAASAAQRQRWLPGLLDGSRVLALAHAERGSRHCLHHVELTAVADADGFVLRGNKHQVLDGVDADAYIVTARSAGEVRDPSGISLFIVPADAAGLDRSPQRRVDARNATLLSLDGVRVPGEALLGKPGEGLAFVERAVDAATVALCGEMLGAMSEAFERTLEYLKERKQFDTVIGSFQALKHRAARMFVEIELARSATMGAARAVDANDPQAPALVSVAKARCSDAFVSIANEAVQLHGGIGMTDEHDIGFFMKRARAAEMTFGDAAHHRQRFAQLHGY